MDYEHLYLYLDARPLEELKECLRDVINLVRNKPDSGSGLANESFSFTSEHDLLMNPAEALIRLHQFQVLQGRVYSSASTNTETEVGVVQCTVSTHTDETTHCTVATCTEMDIETVPCTVGTNTETADKALHHTVATNTDFVQPDAQETESEAAVTVIGRKRSRPQETEEPSRLVWPSKMDAALDRAVATHRESGWAAVAKQVQQDCNKGKSKGKIRVKVEVSKQQCESRWSNHLEPLKRGVQLGREWTKAETTKLRALVQKHTIEPYLSPHYHTMTKERVDWKPVALALDRAPLECRHKVVLMKTATMVKGPYSAEEDALIRQRVEEWGDKGKGLWSSLQGEMNRSMKSILSRWTKNLRES